MRDGPLTIGNYVLCGELARGGMATIYIGHAVGGARPLAIKKLDLQGSSPELIAMFLDELAVAGSVKHKNIAQTIEVVSTTDDLCLVMEYIEGETVSKLGRACREQRQAMPVPIVAGIVCAALEALDAVHEATDAQGRPLEIVHRDVSPQNIVVGTDGVARLLDFGVAKATGRLQQTRAGVLKGKVAYMAPELLELHEVTRLTDLYALAVVLWEALAGARLFEADTEGQLMRRVLDGTSTPPSAVRPDVPPALDAVVMRALAKAPGDRFQTARELAAAIQRATPLAGAQEIGPWVQSIAKKTLEARARRVDEMLAGRPGPGAVPSAPSSASQLGSASTSSSQRPFARSASSTTGRPTRTPSVSTGLRARVSLDDATPGVARTTATGTRAPTKHVLIIDDSPIILDNARRALEAEGYRVTTTSQTVGAARHLVDCDLALIDYYMPGFNGGAVIQSLRAASAASGRTCLFYLFTTDQDVAKDYATLGFDGSVAGKGDDTALVRCVRAAFRVLQMRAMKK